MHTYTLRIDDSSIKEEAIFFSVAMTTPSLAGDMQCEWEAELQRPSRTIKNHSFQRQSARPQSDPSIKAHPQPFLNDLPRPKTRAGLTTNANGRVARSHSVQRIFDLNQLARGAGYQSEKAASA
jgi:hypothetical protein